MEEGISLFSSLLNNKHFLIIFVHALEQQKDFAVRDRSGCVRCRDTGVPGQLVTHQRSHHRLWDSQTFLIAPRGLPV